MPLGWQLQDLDPVTMAGQSHISKSGESVDGHVSMHPLSLTFFKV